MVSCPRRSSGGSRCTSSSCSGGGRGGVDGTGQESVTVRQKRPAGQLGAESMRRDAHGPPCSLPSGCPWDTCRPHLQRRRQLLASRQYRAPQAQPILYNRLRIGAACRAACHEGRVAVGKGSPKERP